MEPSQLIRYVARILKPLADRISQEDSLASRPDAYLKALGLLLDRLSRAELLKERDREVLAALWRVYRRTGRPVGRGLIIHAMDQTLQQCDESTIYRALKRLRDELGFVTMIGKDWMPVFDVEALGEQEDESPLALPPARHEDRAALAAR